MARLPQFHVVARPETLAGIGPEHALLEGVPWTGHADLEEFRAALERGAHGRIQLLWLPDRLADGEVDRMRQLLAEITGLEVVVWARELDASDYRRLLLAGVRHVGAGEWPPVPASVLFRGGLGWEALFPGELEARRREVHDLFVPSRPDQVTPVVRFVCERCDGFGHPREFVRSHLPLIVDELVTNAMKHGHAWKAEQEVHVHLEVDAEEIVICVMDRGLGFQRASVRDPLDAENRTRSGGRGLFLVEHLMDEVEYRDGGRTIEARVHPRESTGKRTGADACRPTTAS